MIDVGNKKMQKKGLELLAKSLPTKVTMLKVLASDSINVKMKDYLRVVCKAISKVKNELVLSHFIIQPKEFQKLFFAARDLMNVKLAY